MKEQREEGKIGRKERERRKEKQRKEILRKPLIDPQIESDFGGLL